MPSRKQSLSTAVDEVRSKLDHMRELECTTYKRPLGLPEPFNGLWRQQIVEWMYTLVKCCELQHSAAAAAAHFLDVAVARNLIETPDDYQLVAMTALYVSLKMYDTPSLRAIKLQSLVELGNGDFNEDDILRMERDLLNSFEWRLCPPTPNCFLNECLTLLPKETSTVTRSKIEELALKAIEIAVARDSFATMKPSTIAHSAILMSFHRMDQGDMPLSQLHDFLGRLENVGDMDRSSCHLAAYNAVLLDNVLESLQGYPEPWLETGDATETRLKDEYEHSAIGDGVSPNSVAR
jgi:hypothetical protein